MLALLRTFEREGTPIRTSGAVVAQVWRDGARQANVARVLGGVDIHPLDGVAGKQIGVLLARSGTSDVVNGHVAVLAKSGDELLTSDRDDITHLLRARGVEANVIAV